MSERQQRTYGIDFQPHEQATMSHILAQVGLSSGRHVIRRVRNAVVANEHLLVMHVPPGTVGELVASQYERYHTGYAEAALSGLPNLADFRPAIDWLEPATPKLGQFATTPEARNIIGGAIAKHYDRIAEVSTLSPSHDDTPFIAAQPNPDGSRDLDRVGVSRTGLPVHRREEVRITQENNRHRTYLPLPEVAKLITWTIPGIETAETKSAILQHFDEVRQNNERVIDPQTLFFAGHIALEGVKTPVQAVFAA